MFQSVPNQPAIENSKKNEKNEKIPLWLLFKPKQVENLREREKIKIIVPISSYPTRSREFHKSIKKIQKIKKHRFGFFSSQNRFAKAEKKRIEIIVKINSYPTHNIEFQKKKQKNSKIRKHYYGFFSSQNRVEKVEKEGKLKLSFRKVTNRLGIENSKKSRKKIQKIPKHHYGVFSSQNRLAKAEKKRK